MKSVIILAILAVLLAFFLPAALAQGGSARTEAPEATASEPPRAAADDALSFTALSDGQLVTVNMSQWLPGVLAGEMPALFETQALKAQAVAARTYILNRRQLGVAAHPDADVCDDPSCCKAHLVEAQLREKWGDGYDEYMEKMTAAVAATDGQYLTYEGEAIEAVFHASSAGKTEDSSAVWNALPYLVSVSSPETAADVPDFVTTARFTVTEFASLLREAGHSPDLSGTPDLWVGDIALDGGGRVESANIGGAPISGSELRSIFSLRSAAFTLDYTDGAFLFTVTGSGHGVGMSQYGANVMAEHGSDYREILAHYYPGTLLTG